MVTAGSSHSCQELSRAPQLMEIVQLIISLLFRVGLVNCVSCLAPIGP